MSRLVAALREARWLDAGRAWAWCAALGAASLLLVAVLLLTSRDGLDLLGRPLGGDFISFWAASHLALNGDPAQAYHMAAHAAAQRLASPAARPDYYAFFYPPTFLLVCLWLGALPYLVAVAVWLTAGFAALLAAVWRILPHRWGLLALAAFPGVLLNAVQGQNGFLSAACLAWAAVLAPRRPFWGGFCLGLLVFKPHLLLAAPVALLAGRRWTMISGGMCSGLGLAALSWLVLGAGAWQGFLAGLPLARMALEHELIGPEKMQSAFAAVQVLHGGLGLAYGVQAVVTLGTLTILGVAIARRPGVMAEVALLATAAMLCTPFLLDYDLVCLALPLAWVAAAATRTGFMPWEKLALLAAYVTPLVSRLLALHFFIPIAPFVLAGLFAIVARRALSPHCMVAV